MYSSAIVPLKRSPLRQNTDFARVLCVVAFCSVSMNKGFTSG